MQKVIKNAGGCGLPIVDAKGCITLFSGYSIDSVQNRFASPFYYGTRQTLVYSRDRHSCPDLLNFTIILLSHYCLSILFVISIDLTNTRYHKSGFHE